MDKNVWGENMIDMKEQPQKNGVCDCGNTLFKNTWGEWICELCDKTYVDGKLS